MLKVFVPNLMKNSGCSNIELRILNWYFDIQNRAFKVSLDSTNLIFGNFPNAKEGFWP